jgi:hypothetical protein
MLMKMAVMEIHPSRCLAKIGVLQRLLAVHISPA